MSPAKLKPLDAAAFAIAAKKGSPTCAPGKPCGMMEAALAETDKIIHTKQAMGLERFFTLKGESGVAYRPLPGGMLLVLKMCPWCGGSSWKGGVAVTTPPPTLKHPGDSLEWGATLRKHGTVVAVVLGSWRGGGSGDDLLEVVRAHAAEGVTPLRSHFKAQRFAISDRYLVRVDRKGLAPWWYAPLVMVIDGGLRRRMQMNGGGS